MTYPPPPFAAHGVSKCANASSCLPGMVIFYEYFGNESILIELMNIYETVAFLNVETPNGSELATNGFPSVWLLAHLQRCPISSIVSRIPFIFLSGLKLFIFSQSI